MFFILSKLVGSQNFYQIGVNGSYFSFFLRMFLLQRETLLNESYYNTVDYEGFISHYIIEYLYNKNIKLQYPHDDFQSNDLTFPGYTHGGSSFLALMLCARFFNDEILSQHRTNVFATGAYATHTVKYFFLKLFLYRNIFDRRL